MYTHRIIAELVEHIKLRSLKWIEHKHWVGVYDSVFQMYVVVFFVLGLLSVFVHKKKRPNISRMANFCNQ